MVSGPLEWFISAAFKEFGQSMSQSIERAAELISEAGALLIGAGAGMGVDSGLPDFRGNQGFWKAYPPFRKLGLDFYDLADPRWFHSDPHLAWGFYGHRLNLYRSTRPHPGYDLLKKWCEAKPQLSFVLTSNVDGHFTKAGFDDESLLEVHGSLNHLQCAASCCAEIRLNSDDLIVDEKTMRASDPLPRCPRCGGVGRPNVLMFGDWSWISDRTDKQHERFGSWIKSFPAVRDLVVVEIGAGTAVPTVRAACERIGAPLIRINPRESQGPPGTVGIPLPALEAIQQIDELLE